MAHKQGCQKQFQALLGKIVKPSIFPKTNNYRTYDTNDNPEINILISENIRQIKDFPEF